MNQRVKKLIGFLLIQSKVFGFYFSYIINMVLRAEHNPIVGSPRASKCAGCIIFRVTVCIRAPLLEEPRVIRWPAAAIRGGAAVAVAPEHGARVVAASRSPQLVRALPVDVSRAPDAPAAPVRSRTEINRNIEPVDERDVEEVQVVELVQGVFGQGVWRSAVGLTLEEATAVAGLASAAAGPVEVAVSSSPNAGSGCARVHVECPNVVSVKLPSAARYSGGPNSEGTVVADLESSCMGVGRERENRKKEKK